MTDEKQREVFLKTEGDKWFERNERAMEKEANCICFFSKYITKGAKVLEIGCANGRNLYAIKKRIDCVCYGVDPSSKAINDGIEKYSGLNLSVSTSDNLPFDDSSFDFVYFGFCMYLIDRTLLTKTIYEADRVLKNKGYIGITDFDNKIPIKRQYKHVEGLYSYKMDYPSLFCAFPHFTLVDKYPYSHNSECFVEEINERVASTVIYKDLDNAYILFD